uniref:Putative trypsin-like serine protease n=1 Tax=Panstrongylus lignarius TaxID=156445 RepID=A0A224XGX5_9HEMI
MFMRLFLLVKIFGIVTPEENSGTSVKAGQEHSPYTVSIHNTVAGNDIEKVCTGFFIGPNWVITAAHCFDGDEIHKTLIKYSISDYSFNTTTTALATKIIIHPEYYNKSLINDLALVSVRLVPEHVKLVSFLVVDLYGITWNRHYKEKRKCITVGFDQVNYQNTLLQVRKLYIRNDPNACGCFATNSDLLCGTARSNESDLCFDNFGGPLVCRETAVGVANRLLQCGHQEKGTCDNETYYRFTNLCAYFQWISGFVDSFPSECLGYKQGLLSSSTYRGIPTIDIIVVFILITSIL